MTKIIRAGQPASLGEIDTTQGEFRSQIDALTDAVRQLGGDPVIAPGATTPNNPLNAPFVLYVDSNIGRDTFVTGDYAEADDGTYETKMKRISLQRLQCGYTISAPFRTLSRAVIEAGIITSRDFLNLVPAPCGDLVTIVLGSGVHTALNGDGGTVSGSWTDGYEPTDAELQQFNPSNGGLVLPRGCSVVSLDLRKTIVRPDFVPEPINEGPDPLITRRAIFKLTGGCYTYGFTIMDKVGFDKSHHLLDGFQFAGQTALDEFYANIRAAFSGVAGINDAYAIPRQSEYRITGPQPETPVEPVDTTAGASPYVYNISVRSEYGLCGMWANGDVATGFRSMVVAQYTGVSLQRDLDNWQKYSGDTWGTFSNYDDLIATNPNNVRFDPERRSYHVRTSNNAIIQEVSVFAIGQSIHHLAESGSQITITNSNSNFGGCASLADGFQPTAAPTDTPWEIDGIRRAVSPFVKTGNIKKIFLGTLVNTQANKATTLELTAPFDPRTLTDQGYSLEPDNYLWVENAGGPDYRALLANPPVDAVDPEKISIKSEVQTDTGINPDDNDDNNTYTNIAGSRIYVRRLRDVRSVSERRYSLLVSSATALRLPIRDYVIQPEGDGLTWLERIQSVTAAETIEDVDNGMNVELRYSKRPEDDTDFSPTTYYRPADVVRREDKHWFANTDNYGPWDEKNWDEAYVHMEESYDPEGYYLNAQPILTFNSDKDGNEDSTTLGNSFANPIAEAQLVSGVDYIALDQLLQNLDVDAATAAAYLVPQAEDSRDLDLSSNSWDVEFRRPTTIRLFGHAFEWAGYSNYSKALPQYQGDLSGTNQFTYYFTNKDGGKVYGSGFNQDGLTVSPRGLEDITTGEILGIEDIGNPNRPIDIPEIEFVWTRVGNTLLPTNPGDEVNITAPGGAVNISLNNDGSAEFEAKIETASTVDADPGQTLVTKDYITGTGKEGDIGFWTREGTDLYPVNGNTDSVKVGGTLKGAPNIELNQSGVITTTEDALIKGMTVGAGGDGTVVISRSTALGFNALLANTGGSFNVAVGAIALRQNLTGSNNTAVGQSTMSKNTEGDANTAVGRNALSENTTGNNCVAIGVEALQNTDASNNIGIGHLALRANTTGNSNVAIGRRTMVSNPDGVNNTLLGTDAGRFVISGSNNTILGPVGLGTSGGGPITLNDTIVIGAGQTEKLRIDDTGSLLFGGVLPAAPNIELKASGKAIFADNVSTINGVFFASRINAQSRAFVAKTGSIEGIQILADGTTSIGGDLTPTTPGGVTPTAPSITLSEDGSGTFQNTVRADTRNSGDEACFFAINNSTSLGDAAVKILNGSTIPGSGTLLSGLGPNAVPVLRIDNAGQITSDKTTINPLSSERRLKENIVAIDADTAWETIKLTPYYTYNFIGNPVTSYGPMADEVPAEMVVQPMVEDEDGVKVARADEEGPIRTYDNGMLQARLYTALQTALTRIEALEAEVNALKGA